RHRSGSCRAASWSWLDTCLARVRAHSRSPTKVPPAAAFPLAVATSWGMGTPRANADNPPTTRALLITFLRSSLWLVPFVSSLAFGRQPSPKRRFWPEGRGRTFRARGPKKHEGESCPATVSTEDESPSLEARLCVVKQKSGEPRQIL